MYVCIMCVCVRERDRSAVLSKDHIIVKQTLHLTEMIYVTCPLSSQRERTDSCPFRLGGWASTNV